MKIRSFLLVACMLLVPALAMFSHRLPAGARASLRQLISRTAARWTNSTTSDPAPEKAPAASFGDQATPSAAAAVGSTAAMPEAVSSAPLSPPPLAADHRRQWESELGRLGAIRIDCRPLQGVDGVHVASCGVPLDAAGQLVRVFHASGTDPAAATRALLDDVAGWKQRSAGGVRAEPALGSQPASGQRF